MMVSFWFQIVQVQGDENHFCSQGSIRLSSYAFRDFESNHDERESVWAWLLEQLNNDGTYKVQLRMDGSLIEQKTVEVATFGDAMCRRPSEGVFLHS